MPAVTTFDSTKESLLDLLQNIKKGKTQLPDFQRGWIWDDEHIKSLLASISLSYPIGALMMLETGNEEVRLKPRPIEGVDLDDSIEPERLILDGQQRLTSLFQALYFGNAVKTQDARSKKISRWYYIDMARALDAEADRDEVILGLPGDLQVKNFRGEVVEDYSTKEKEFLAGYFPLSQIFDCSDWRTSYFEFCSYEKEKIQLFNQFDREVIKRFEQYQVPVIILRKETPKEAVCQVFEKVNTGGVSLTVFELLTATFAADNYSLRDDWEKRKKVFHEHKILSTIQSDDFLQAITLLASRKKRLHALENKAEIERVPGITCKRKDILRLTLDDYKEWGDLVENGFVEAVRLIMGQKIYDARDLPYRTQLVPLAAILAILGKKSENEGVRAKLARWYWCGVFGELYGSATETRFAKDLPEILAWIDGGAEPSTIVDANFAPDRLLTLRTRNSAAYKGLYAILLRDGCQEFRTGDAITVQMYFDDKLDIHHIFPQAWCRTNGIDPKHCDSIVNKTAIAAKTNRMIGGNAPDAYLPRLEKRADISEDRMNEILVSHVIDFSALRSNNFDEFFEARKQALLERIENAMGKQIPKAFYEEGSSPEPIDYEEEDIPESGF